MLAKSILTFLKNNVKVFIFLSLFFFLIGFASNTLIPYLRFKSKEQIVKFNNENKNIELRYQKIRLLLFPLGIKLTNVEVLAKKPLQKYFSTAKAKDIHANIDFFSLYRGQPTINSLILVNGSVKLNIDSENLLNSQNSNDFDFNKILDIPIQSIKIDNFDIEVKDTAKKIALRSKEFSVLINKAQKGFLTQLTAKKTFVKEVQNQTLHHGDLSLKFLINKEKLQVESIKLNQGKSFIIAFGSIFNPFDEKKLNFNIQSRIQLNFPLFNSQFEKIIKLYGFSFPNIKGNLRSDIVLSGTLKKLVNFDLDLNSNNLVLDNFNIGQIQAQSKIKNEQILFEKLSVKNQSGLINFKNFVLNLDTPYNFNFESNLVNLNLKKLLENIDLKNIPVFAIINANSKCKGNLKPLFLNCSEATLNLKNLVVKDSLKTKNSIISIKEASAKGNYKVDSNKVTYDSFLSIFDSFGTSDGVIDYNKGFKINFDGDIQEFKKIGEISQLKFEGSGQLKGNTSGNSRSATVSMNVKGSENWFENYFIGSPELDLEYKKGTLFLNNIKGELNKSKYLGNISVNVIDKEIFAKVQSTSIRAEDGALAFSRLVKLPFEVEGSGELALVAHGPLDLSKLTYQLNSKFYKPKIWKENFDRIVFNVSSNKGHVVSEDIHATKGSGRFDLIAKVKPDAQLDAQFVASDFRVEQSSFLNSLGLQANGEVNFKGHMLGHILKPYIKLIGGVNNLIAQDNVFPNSSFSIEVDEHDFKIDFNLFKSQAKASYHFPFRSNDHDYKFNFLSNKLQIQNIFYLFPYFSLTHKYKFEIDSVLQWNSKDGNLYGSTGNFVIPHFYVNYSGKELKNDKVIDVSFNYKQLNVKPFMIVGENTFLKVNESHSKYNDLNLNIDGKIDLSYFHLLTPFFEEINGTNAFSVKIGGTVFKPKITGSSYIRNGICQLKSLIHPFTDIHADVLFSEKTVLINSLKGRFGKGPFLASGNIGFNGSNNIPIQINGSYNNAQLNIPEGFKTLSEGNFKIEGNWFPYTLKGNINIINADIKKNFDQKDSGETIINASEYLPQFIKIKEFEPLELDMNVKLINPADINVQVNTARIKTQVLGGAKINKYPHSPILTGQFFINRGGEVRFRSNDFEIINGRIDYFNAPPQSPEIFATAQARITSMTNEVFDVNLLLQGTPQEPKLKINSQPPMEEHELISLLALGITTTETEKYLNSEEHAAQTSLQLTSTFLKSQLGISNELEKKLGFEFEFSSDFVEDDQVSVPKVTIKKQVLEDLLLSASRTFEKNPIDKLAAEYRMNNNFSVIGTLKSQSYGAQSSQENNQVESDIFGLDLEYKVEFK